MNIGSITSVLIDKVRHLQISLGDVVSHIDGLPRRQRPVLQVLLPSTGFEDARSILGQVDGVHPIVDGV